MCVLLQRAFTNDKACLFSIASRFRYSNHDVTFNSALPYLVRYTLRLRRYTPPKHSSNVILVLSFVYRLRQKPHIRSFLAPSFTHIHNEYTTVILRSQKLTQRIHIVSNVNLPSTHMCSAFGATPPFSSPTFSVNLHIHIHIHYTFTPHVHILLFFTSIYELFYSFLYTSFITL